MPIFRKQPHKNELRVPEPALRDPDGVEIARIWAANDSQVVALRPDVWDDPTCWGLMLVDLAKHVANAYAQMGRGDAGETLMAIRRGFDAEWGSPTDEPAGTLAD